MGYVADLPVTNTKFPMLGHDIVDDCVWNRELLSAEDWIVPLPDDCLAELDAMVAWASSEPTASEAIRRLNEASGALRFPACTKVMSHVRTKLKYQAGIAVIDRIPVERYGIEDRQAIYLGLASMLGPLGWPAADHPNLMSWFRTEGAGLYQLPEFVGLSCLGHRSQYEVYQLVSLMTIHNEMRLYYPDLLPRLYQPFRWESQAGSPAHTTGFSSYVVYRYDGRRVVSRYDLKGIRNGYLLSGDILDDRGEAALDALQTLVENPIYQVEFCLEPGQLQYLNNHRLAYTGRSPIESHEQQFGECDTEVITIA